MTIPILLSIGVILCGSWLLWRIDRWVKKKFDEAEEQGREDAIDLGAYSVWHEGKRP